MSQENLRDIRTMNMTEGQKIESDQVLKRIGDLSYRNLGTLAKSFLFDEGKALIVGGGCKVEPSSNMIINVPSGSVFQRFYDVIPCLQKDAQTVTLDAATGVARTDIIEAQVTNVTDKDEVVQVGSVVTGTAISISNQSIKRDIKHYLSVRNQTGTTTTTAATAGTLTGTVAIATTIDLSTKYLINLSDLEDGSFQEVDCRGATPAATTRAEIIANINSAVGRTMAATGSGNVIELTGDGTGITSTFKIKPPSTDTDKDALEEIFGVSIGGIYRYTYEGTNEWFKLAEIDVGVATTVITTGLIRNVDQQSTWTGSTDAIKLMNNLETYFNKNTISIDTINEETVDNGVDLEGLNFKDDAIENINFTDIIKSSIREFTIATGESITSGDVVELVNGTIQKGIGNIHEYGSPVVFESASTTFISATTISENKVLIAYGDVGNSGYGTAIVCDISGTIPTFGSPVVFESADSDYIVATTISENKVLIAYQDVGNSGYGTAIVCDISGTIPTFGTAVVFESASTLFISTVTISENKVLIAYRDAGNANKGTAIVCNVSGTIPTFGTAVVFHDARIDYTTTTTISENKVFIAFYDGISSTGKVIIGTVSGTVPTFGTAVETNGNLLIDQSVVTISENKVLLAYRDNGNSDYGTAIVCNISGTVPTFGTEAIFEYARTEELSLTTISENKVLIAFEDQADSSYGTAIVCNVSGTIPTFGSPVVFESASTTFISATTISENKVLIAYGDVGNSGYGTAIVCNVSESIGIALESGTSGQSKKITLNRQVSYNHSNLISWRSCWSFDGTIEDLLLTNGKYIGQALSSTEILLSKDL